MPTPAGLCTDVVYLVNGIATLLVAPAACTVVVPVPPVHGATSMGEVFPALSAAGWVITPPVSGSAWLTLRRETPHGRHTIHLCVRAWSDDPFITDGEPGALYERLNAWERVTGQPYRYTAGASTLAHLRDISRKVAPRWRLLNGATLDPWQPPTMAITDIRHIDPAAKQASPYLWKWDTRSAYLASAAAVTLPYKTLRHTGTEPSTLNCGYYRVLVNPDMLGSVQWWMLPRPDAHGAYWVTHDLLNVLIDEAKVSPCFEVLDSYTPNPSAGIAAGHGRILRSWAESWRDAIMFAPNLAPELKLGYSSAIGLMAVPSGSVYRPDWRHMIIGRAASSLTYKILRVHRQTGLWPVRVDVDAVFYDVADIWDHNAATARVEMDRLLGVGPRIGNMRFEGPVALSDAIPAPRGGRHQAEAGVAS